MPRYFMHLVDSTDVLLDPEGLEIASEKIAANALFQARDCMAGDVKNGHLDLRYRIEVWDQCDKVVHCLEFADALEISRSS